VRTNISGSACNQYFFAHFFSFPGKIKNFQAGKKQNFNVRLFFGKT